MASIQWPLKKPDGDPLYRRDIQFDLLAHVFGDSSFRFTPPLYPPDAAPLFPTDRPWSFAELYLDSLANSHKAAKNLKDKMAESQFFAVAFGKVALLINVGRINTTIAFFSEMKTAMRTYHPLPSMQLDQFTRKNLQDAPRMKTQLKGCALYEELANPTLGMPETLKEVARRGASGQKPPTGVAGLIFLLFQEHHWISEVYFHGQHSLQELFCPVEIPSDTRSRVFLSLIYRYLEQPELALQVHEQGHVTSHTALSTRLEPADTSLENVDPPEELEFAQEMLTKRAAFLQSEKAADSAEGRGSVPVQVDADDSGDNEEAVLEPISNATGRYAATAAPQYFEKWTEFCKKREQSAFTGLDLAWRRTHADAEEGRDPADDSEEDVFFMPIELRARLCGFQFGDAKKQQQMVYRYHPSSE